jgi:hypothetical protein
MFGLIAWSVSQGHGSFLTFEFGEPKLEVAMHQLPENGFSRSANLRGQFHLWIYCCHWRALQDVTQLAWSEDAPDVIGSATARLNGQRLVAIKVEPTNGRSTFTFDLGGSLETWPYGDDPTDEQWIILTGGEAFAYRADGLYNHQPIGLWPAEERWLPLR